MFNSKTVRNKRVSVRLRYCVIPKLPCEDYSDTSQTKSNGYPLAWRKKKKKKKSKSSIEHDEALAKVKISFLRFVPIALTKSFIF